MLSKRHVIKNVSVARLTSILTASTLSMCLLKICLRTKSGPLNFFPLSGQSHLSFASSWVFASTNLFVSVYIVKKRLHTHDTDTTLITKTTEQLFWSNHKHWLIFSCPMAFNNYNKQHIILGKFKMLRYKLSWWYFSYDNLFFQYGCGLICFYSLMGFHADSHRSSYFLSLLINYQ